MLKWIRRLLPVSKEEQRRRFLAENDAFNAQLYGGPPRVVQQFLGHLRMRSGTLVLGDPQSLPAAEVPNVPSAEVAISARLRRYPSGMERIMLLTMTLGKESAAGPSRQIGDLDIGSTKLVVIDKADFEEHWTHDCVDRVGQLESAWGFIPVGPDGGPQMFVCGTGRGDGFYDVHCTFSGEAPSVLSIEFIEDNSSDSSAS